MTDQLQQDEKELLRSEIRTAHEAADITAQLVIKQFEETYQVLKKLEDANEYLDALHQTTLNLIGRLNAMDLLQDPGKRFPDRDPSDNVWPRQPGAVTR